MQECDDYDDDDDTHTTTTNRPQSAYDRHKEAARQRQADQSRATREIGELPPVVNPQRKADCARNFRLYCEQYHPKTFELAWSQDHLDVIYAMQQTVLVGGQQAIAMPRGSGKTSLCIACALWTLVYHHRAFVVIIGPDEDHAINLIEDIRTELETNEILAEDFPEYCYPIRKLEGIPQKRLLYNGDLISMRFKSDRIRLPYLKGTLARGGMIQAAGITGQLRGMVYLNPDGKKERPSFILIDDPQTDASAYSPAECEKRSRVIDRAVLGLAGPNIRPSVLAAVTVIRPGDTADNLVDQQKSPDWHGIRTGIVDSLPTNIALWKKYYEIKQESGDDAATDYYRNNRGAMDEGCKPRWPERVKPGQISAVQYAMDIFLSAEEAFWSEYMNRPLQVKLGNGRTRALSRDSLLSRLSGCGREVLPQATTRVTAFVDIQKTALYWMACAWDERFGGAIVDYGTWPQQPIQYYTLTRLIKTLVDLYPAMSQEQRWYAAIKDCVTWLVTRKFSSVNGQQFGVQSLLIDAGDGAAAKVIYDYLSRTNWPGTVFASKGAGIGPDRASIGEWKCGPGERKGHNWIQSITQTHQYLLQYDTNYWKEFVADRLESAEGTSGNIYLPQMQGRELELLVDHLCAEFGTKTSGKRDVEIWKPKPDNFDNHWWDCLVGCTVGASLSGLHLSITNDAPAPAPRRVKYSEKYKHKFN